MEMTFTEYLKHYFGLPDFLIFFAIVMALVFIYFAIFYARSKSKAAGDLALTKEGTLDLLDRFYELVFSGTSIIGFMALYYLINRFAGEPFKSFWDKYMDFLLLILMIVSILFNCLLDRFFLPIKRLEKDEIASVRMIGMVYMIIIFCYIKFIYEDDNYDTLITYFLTLMIGRFVYFDASFHEFLDNVKRAFLNLPLMLLALAGIGILAAYGFKSDYLLTHNGVITNLFIAHIFICVAIFILNIIVNKFIFKENHD